jgi:thiamine-monophosphate kinase
MKISDIGEVELIRRIRETIVESGVAGDPADIPIGIGDDAALLRVPRGHVIVTTDHAVEGVHFLPDRVSARAVGRRAMAANVSDIAAMGGQPRYAVVALALPKDTEAEWVIEMYRGMAERCRESGVALVGGDVSGAPVRVVEITLFGVPARYADGAPLVLRRDTARPGDRVAVTGRLGGAGGGMRVVYSDRPEGERQDLANAFLHPPVRVQEAQALLDAGVRTAMDLSDGLVTDLSKLCAASGLAARIRPEALPLHPALREAFSDDAVALALSGGEDYEILFTCPADVLERVRAALPCPVTEVGEVVEGAPGQVVLVDSAGREMTPDRTGWAHF